MTTDYLIGGTTNLGLGSSWSLTNDGSPANETPTSTDAAEMDLAASILGTLTAAELDINAGVSIANPVTTTVASGSTTIGNSATGSVTVSSTWNQAGYLQVGGADAGTLTVDSSGDVVNTATQYVGALTITGSVSGSVNLGTGAQDTLALGGAVTATGGVSFNGWYETLAIGDASGFQSPIHNFMPGDTIALTNVQYDASDSNYSFSYGSGGGPNDLEITEGDQTFNFNVRAPVSLSSLPTLKPDASGRGADVVFTSGGGSPFNRWGLPLAYFFSTASGPVNGSDWATSNSQNGDEPVWIETETPASTYVAGQSASYTIVLTTQDWLGDLQPLVPVTTTDLIDPFGRGRSNVGNLAAADFISYNGVTASMDLVYWQASTTPGDYAVELQPLTTTNITSPTTGPSTTLTGAPSQLDAAVSQPLSWFTADNNTSNSAATEGVLAYAAYATATTENIYLQGFTMAGVASTSPILVGTIPDRTFYSISYGNGTFNYSYYSQTGASGRGFYAENFNPTTGQLSSPDAYLLLPGFARVSGESGVSLSDGTYLRFVEGFQTIGDKSQQVIQDFLGDGSPTAATTIDLSDTTSDDFAIASVTDPNDGQLDYTVLTYTNDNEVHLDLFNDQGIQIGSDLVVWGITSFDQIDMMYGGADDTYRVEIDYTVSDPSGGTEVDGLIYSTEGTADVYTLSGGGEDIGSPFDDTITDGPGNYTVNGGGGSDTFIVPFLSSQVTVIEDLAGDVIVNSPDGVTTLALFSTINLNDATIAINGNTLTETNNDGALTISTFNVTGQSYSGYDQLYDKGVFLGTDYLFTGVADQPYSSYQYDYSAGNEFIGSQFFYTNVTGEPYTGYEYDYDSAGPATRIAFTGVTGTGYSAYEYDFVGGVFSGSKYEMTLVPAGASYSSYELDYTYAGAYAGDKFFFTNVPGQSYTDEEEDFNASGQLTTVALTGISNQAYSSLEEDYNGGAYTGYKAYYTDITGQNYTEEEVDVSATNQLDGIVYSGMTSTPYSSVEQDYSGGTLSDVIYSFTNVTGQPYYAYQVEETPGGAALQATFDLNSGGHDLNALASGRTLTSLGDDTMTGDGSTTFVLNAIYGADTITNLTHSDIVSMPSSEFTNFTALSNAASMGAGGAVITASDGDTLTLDGITTSQLQTFSGDFTFHA
jgi:T5SS/PEP-CTERM-associated repeat protein